MYIAMSDTQYKIWLIIKKDMFTSKDCEYFKTLLYDKIYILSNTCKNTYIDWKVTVVAYDDISLWLEEIYQINQGQTLLIPFFSWDRLAKYSIDVYNHTFSTNIQYARFKDKDMINDTIQSISKKKFIYYTFKELLDESYDHIVSKWLKKFIIKPQSWSSSLMTFLVENLKDFDIVKQKLSSAFNYIIEEYFEGELNSVDFYHDGENLYILAYIKESALKDLYTTHQFSDAFLNTFKKDLKLFNFLIPVRYNESFKNITHEELTFISKIKDVLAKLPYRWYIHLEYKFDTSTNTIGFVERWARLWFKRKLFIEQVYTNHMETFNIPYLILNKKLQWFDVSLPGVYILKENITNTNIIWMRTSFYKKTSKNFTTIKMFEDALSRSLREYFSTTFDVHISDIQYIIIYKEWNTFYPFYQSNDTRLDYLLFFNDKDFLVVKEHIGEIVEHLVFNDFLLT